VIIILRYRKNVEETNILRRSIAFESSIIISLTIIGKDILINNIYFTIKIQIINH